MQNFEFFNPVHVIFGQGEIARVGSEAARLGTRALLVTYEEHDFLADTLDRIQSDLELAGITVVQHFEISPNPLISQAQAGAQKCRANNIDLVIAVGGGSVMDAAKVIAAGVYYQGDLWQMMFDCHDASHPVVPPVEALPLLTVPTVPATGSEMNPTAVITRDNTLEKTYTWAPCLYPKVSIVDPALTCSLPPYVTACSAADTIAHVLEFHLTGYDFNVNNRLQEAVMLTVIDNVRCALEDPSSIDARANLQWASIVALNGITQPGDGWTPMHQLGHVISGRFNVAHGAALTIVMPAWMKHFYRSRLDRYTKFATRVFGVEEDGKSEEAIALEGIARFEAFLNQIGVPTRLVDVKIGADMIEQLTDDVVRVSFGADNMLFSRPPASREDVAAVFRLALER